MKRKLKSEAKSAALYIKRECGKVAERLTILIGLPYDQCEFVIDEVFHAITDEINENGECSIKGFGTFIKVWDAPRKVHYQSSPRLRSLIDDKPPPACKKDYNRVASG